MTKTYEQVLGGQNNLANVRFDDMPATGSPGRQFVWGCRRANITPLTGMGQLNTRFYQWLAQRGWTWDPGVPGNSYLAGARVLDGVVNRGECAYPAYALAYMINAPQPYGFGVGGASVVTFSGANAAGFISNHAGALQGPQPNITRPEGGALPGYYYWANHKVVQYGGQYYDPNYNAVYAMPAGMAAASLQVVRQNARLRDLADYNPLSPWGLLLGWGLPRLLAQGTSDLLFGNTHTITVQQTTVGAHPAVAGYYIEWSENWALPRGGRGNIYGPKIANPLAR